MKKGTIIAIVIVAVVLIGAVVAYFVFFSNDKEGGKGDKKGTLYRVNTAETALNVRQDADVTSGVITTVDKGSTISITEVKNNFGYSPSVGGWLSMDYLKKA